ncbi:peptidoglycan D,D-transpeptidase FtsI family protein [Planctomicrobium sp. SH661]|uniref:peptidoglycan D,D-transpeptidase FtsI family protein n=1 Tax=Planctomicrobium sp. SH661 TaxID=3448124 RepID=UPI003F5C0C25
MRNQPFSQIDTDDSDSSGVQDDPRRRPWILAGMLAGVLCLIGARVAYVQTAISNRYIAPWEQLTAEEEEIPSRDGRIVSRDGVVLAQDESRYDITIDYRWLQTPPHPRWLRQQVSQQLDSKQRRDPALRAEMEEKILQQRKDLMESLALVTHVDEALLTDRMAAIQKRIETMLAAVERKRVTRKAERQQNNIDWSDGMTGIWKVLVRELTMSPERYEDDPIILKEELQDHLILKDVPLEVAAAIQSQPVRFPGVHVRSTSTRAYPFGDLAAHLIGVRKSKSSETASKAVENRVGESGVERFHTGRLEGTSGLIEHQKNVQGERVESHEVRAPRDGEDVTLTIDSRLQRIAEELLDTALTVENSDERGWDAIPEGAALVAMDLWTGDLLTLACSPRPSLTVLARPTASEWEELQKDPRHPLFPRTTQMALPPGKLFQVVVAAAALEEGVTTPDQALDCRGYLDRPEEYRCTIYRHHGIGHGAVQVGDAFCQSCDVYFYEMARRLGRDPICDWAGRFGLGKVTGLDLPGEKPGTIPHAGTDDRKWSPAATLQLATGQGTVLVTPLQMARMMAAIANGGYLVTPRVTMPEVEESSQQVAGVQKIPGLSEPTLREIRRSLERVVEDSRGPGRSARIEMMTLAGHSATADAGVKPPHSWFAGYAPADHPKVAFAVVLEHGGAESDAGPIVQEFVTELLGYGYLRPSFSDAVPAE